MSRAKNNMYKLIGRIESVDTAMKVSKALLPDMGVDMPALWYWAVYRELMAKIGLLKMEQHNKWM